MTLTVKDVGEIMKLLAESRFTRLDLEIDGMKLRLARDGAKLPPASPTPAPPPAPSPSKPPPPPKPRADRTGLIEVCAPLLGIFYRAPRPGDPPFVEVGSNVAADSIIGIIEVMKLMTSARAGVAGEIVEIVAPNGELVESGAVLMLVRPAS